MDGRGRPLSVVVTAGNVNDTTVFEDVLAGIRVARPVARPRTRPERVVADKGYSAGGRPYAFSKRFYKRRNVVERRFNRFKDHRGIATRYDRLARDYLGALNLISPLD